MDWLEDLWNALNTPLNKFVLYPMGLVFVVQLILLTNFRIWSLETQKRINWANQLTSAYTVLGVLGTFLGIFVGLRHFDPDKINSSIPGLLEGMKTAFATSIAGILLSLIMGLVVRAWLDKIESKEISPMDLQNQLLTEIKNGMEQQAAVLAHLVPIHKQQGDHLAKMLSAQEAQAQDVAQLRQKFLQEENKDIASVRDAIGSVLEKLSALAELLGDLRKTTSENTVQATESKQILQRLEEVSKASVERLSEIDEKIDGQRVLAQETNNELRALKQGQLDYAEKLDAHVSSLIETMGKNSELLERKFDEFSELLQKSNTEALVEVMKQATESFNEQMRELIDRLVKENFEALNQSVERLNTWQQENKEMIQRLTDQFKEVADHFQITEQEIARIVAYANSLVGDGGKLANLLEELERVLVEENKFVDVALQLQGVSDKVEQNIEKWHETNEKMNQWVRNHMDLVTEVGVLIKKLDELGKIKDYNEKFWEDTRRQLQEGIGMIEGAIRRLRSSLDDIDSVFYDRLNNSFENLDQLIQSWMRHSRNGR